METKVRRASSLKIVLASLRQPMPETTTEVSSTAVRGIALKESLPDLPNSSDDFLDGFRPIGAVPLVHSCELRFNRRQLFLPLAAYQVTHYVACGNEVT